MIQLSRGRVLRAIDLMMILHKDQSRKGKSIPYITHLFSVASKVLECGGDEDQFISALLHDSIEDQGKVNIEGIWNEMFFKSIEESKIAIEEIIHSLNKDIEISPNAIELLNWIAKFFGKRVAYIIFQCSDSFTYPKKPWRERKEEFIKRCYTLSHDVKLIVACDKWHNLYSIYCDYCLQGDAIWSQFNGGKEGTIWYYREVIKALKANWYHSILVELDFFYSSLLEKANGGSL